MPDSFYREEALQAYEAGLTDEGVPVILERGWLPSTYWFVVLVVATGVTFACTFRLSEYAHGRAIVQGKGRLDVVSSTGGTPVEVSIRVGQHVRAGQPLVHFYAGPERSLLERTTKEFELKLVGVLQDPGATHVREGLGALRAERDLARVRLQERTVVAPRNGLITNVRLRAGQSVNPGEVVLTMVEEHSAPSYAVVAFVPAHFRPMVKIGSRMRLALDGFAHTYADVTIESVSNEAVGPTEARRQLGPEAADALVVHGPLIVIKGQLPGTHFEFDQTTYQYHDGLPGAVHVKVHSTRIITMLFPYLREVFGHGQRGG
ncbi:MAG TPA: HlyD family efflux transporter periplasmic adaptor subunit [Polyangia bacterium]